MPRPHSHIGARGLVRSHVFVTALWAAAWAGLTPVEGFAQELRDIPETLLRQVLPQAERFDERSGDPLVFRGWAMGAEGEVLVGYAFHTADVPPERRGYSGPVETLVGMDLQGRITGVRITDYWESISSTMGDFLRRPGVQEQFAGKHISDGFSPRDDVRAVSRATISTRGLALGIRDAARRVANAYLATSIETTDPLRPVEDLSWYELQQRGVLVPVVVSGRGDRSAEITLAYMESAVFAERLVGPDAVAMAERYWADTGHQDHVFFYGLDGTDLQLFRREGWSVIQDGDTLPIPPSDFHPFGLSSGGLLVDQLITGGVLIVDGVLDVERAFRFQYDYPPTPPPYSAEYRTEAARARTLEAVEYVRRDPPPDSAVAPTRGDGDATTPPAGGQVETVASQAELGNPTSDPGDPASSAREGVRPPEDAAATPSAGADSAPVTDAPGPGAPAETPSQAETAQPGGESTPAVADQARPLAPSPLELPADLFKDRDEGSLLADALATTRWGRFMALVGLLTLALVAFLTKHEALRWVVLGITFLYLGFVDGGFLSVSHVTAAIAVGPGVFVTDLPLLAMVSFTVVTTLVWGRVFCGYLCPFGALQDFLTLLVPESLQRVPGSRAHRRGLWVKYGVLVILIGATAAGLRLPLYAYVEPFGTVFFFSTSAVLWGIAVAVLAASAVIPRFYCRYLCPLGAALAVGSVLAPSRIRRVEHCDHCKVCEQHCPTGAIVGPEIDFKECVRCSDCEVKLREEAGVCRHPIEEVRARLVPLRVPATGAVE